MSLLPEFFVFILVGAPLVLLGIRGWKQEKENRNHFYTVLTDVLGNSDNYKGRKIAAGDLSEGAGEGIPCVMMLLSERPKVSFTTQLSLYFGKGIQVHRDRLTVTCYRHLRRKISRESMIGLLEKLSSAADTIELR